MAFSLLISVGCAGHRHQAKGESRTEVKSRLKTASPAKRQSHPKADNTSVRTESPTPERTDAPSSTQYQAGAVRKASSKTGSDPIIETKLQYPQPDVQLNKQYFYGFIPDTIHLITSPLRWNAKDWLLAGLVSGATVGIGFLDQDIQDAFGNSPDEVQEPSHDIFQVGEAFGNGGYAAGYLTLLYLTGMARDDEELKSTVLLAGESFLVSGLFVEFLKHMFARGRPNTVEDPDEFEGPDFTFDQSLSFPSGHTATAFAIATVFARQYQRHVWVPPVLYSLATLTAVSRVADNVHWASDVVFGAALGYFTASALYKMHLTDKPNRLGVRPMVSPSAKGIAVDYRF